MPFLDWTIYQNSLRAWGFALLVAAITLFGLLLVRRLVVAHLSRLADRTANDWDDLAARVLASTRFTFLFFIALFVGSQALLLPERVLEAIGVVTFFVLLFQLAIWGNAAIGGLIHRYTTRQLEEDAAAATTMRFVGFISRLALWVVILLVALDNVGVDITALVAGLGVGGIAVALAVQNILGDLFASLSIVLDKPFVIGDFIIVGDLLGTVEHVGLKTTRVRSLSGEQLVFSNTDLLSSRIRNFKRMYERRVVFSFGVVYQTPHALLERIPPLVKEIVEAQQDTRFDRAHFASYGDSALVFEVVYYVLVPDYNVYMDIQQAINLELYRRFEALGIDFAYPTRTVYLHEERPVAATS